MTLLYGHDGGKFGVERAGEKSYELCENLKFAPQWWSVIEGRE